MARPLVSARMQLRIAQRLAKKNAATRNYWLARSLELASAVEAEAARKAARRSA